MVIFNSYVKLPEGKPKEPLHLVLKGPPPETRALAPDKQGAGGFLCLQSALGVAQGGKGAVQWNPQR